jgi:hypothetical protein
MITKPMSTKRFYLDALGSFAEAFSILGQYREQDSRRRIPSPEFGVPALRILNRQPLPDFNPN